MLDDTPMRADAPVHLRPTTTISTTAHCWSMPNHDDRLHLNAATAAALGVEQGSPVRVLPYCTGRKHDVSSRTVD
ncbi:hypothetical protein M8494_07325 [Serratia ureilytica]